MDFEEPLFKQDIGHDVFFSQRSRSFDCSTPGHGLSISLPEAGPFKFGHEARNISVYTPRSMLTTPRHLPSYPTPLYRPEETYTISSATTSARGRSGSEASINSGHYLMTSPKTTPTSPYTLSGAGSQYLPSPYDARPISFETSTTVPSYATTSPQMTYDSFPIYAQNGVDHGGDQ
jgi:hypothetical protein